MKQKSRLILLIALVLIIAPACRLFSTLAEGGKTSFPEGLESPTNKKETPDEPGAAEPVSPGKQIVQPTLPAVERPSRIGVAILATLARYPRTLRGEITQPGDSFPTLITIWYESETAFQFELVYLDGRFIEFITLPPEAYLNPGDGWQAYQGDFSEAVFETYNQLNTVLSRLALLIPQTDPQPEDGSTLSEVPVELYTFEATLSEGGNRSIQLWIGIDDGLVYKYTLSDPNGASEEGLLNFSTPVVIEPPIQDDPEE